MSKEALDVLGWGLWGALGAMMLMFGLAWLSAARLVGPLGRGVNLVAAFNLVEGSALLLIGLRAELPFAVGYTLQSLLVILAYVLMWRAAASLVGLPDMRREQVAVVVVGWLLVLMFSASPSRTELVPAVHFLANAWVAARAGLQVAHKLHVNGRPGLAVSALACAWSMAVPLFSVGVGGLLLQGPLNQEASLAAQPVVAGLGLVCAFVCNLVVGIVVFGRVVTELNRLTERDPMTGLANGAVIERTLAYEWTHRGQRRAELAVVALTIDEMDCLRENFGSTTCELVVGEVARQIEPFLRAGDVLGHLGEGRFVAVLPDVSPEVARGMARAFRLAVAAESSLHPDASQRLTVSAGVATSAEAADSGSLLRLSRGRCEAAEAAGGDGVYAGHQRVSRAPNKAAALVRFRA